MNWDSAAVIIVVIVVLSAISALYLLVLRLTYSTEDENPTQQHDDPDSDPEPDSSQVVAPILSPKSPAEDVDRFLLQNVSPDQSFSEGTAPRTPVALEASNEPHGEIGYRRSVNAAVVNTSNPSPKGSTMTQWFYMKDGLEVGPVDTSELKRLAARGELSPTDTIWKEGLEAWIPASKAKGLFGDRSTPRAEESNADPLPKTTLVSIVADQQTSNSGEASTALPVIPPADSKISTSSNDTSRQRLMLLGLGVSLLLVASCSVWYFALRRDHLVAVEGGLPVTVKNGMPATVKGGAWLTKRAENSEPIRGLKIYAIPKDLPRAYMIQAMQGRVDNCQRIFDVWKAAVADNRQNAESFLKDAKSTLADAQKAYSDIVRDTTVERYDSRLVYMTCKAADVFITEKTHLVDDICKAVLLAQSVSDADGKYEMAISTSQFCLVAEYDSDYVEVLWCIPVDTNESDVRVDFWKGNAMHVNHKDH